MGIAEYEDLRHAGSIDGGATDTEYTILSQPRPYVVKPPLGDVVEAQGKEIAALRLALERSEKQFLELHADVDTLRLDSAAVDYRHAFDLHDDAGWEKRIAHLERLLHAHLNAGCVDNYGNEVAPPNAELEALRAFKASVPWTWFSSALGGCLLYFRDQGEDMPQWICDCTEWLAAHAPQDGAA